MRARYLNLYGIMNSRFVKNRIKRIEKRMSICYDVHIHFIGCVWENNEPKERQKAMNKKIWKALGIAVCMLVLAAPHAMAETNSHYVSNNEQFADAVRTINNESKIGDKNEIVLMQDITLERNYILTNGKTTTIKGKEGEDRKISINGSNDPNAGITVTGERTVLNLGVNGYDKKLTIDGDTRDGSASGNAKNAFVSVLEGATANMYGNVTLQNGMFGGNACVVIMGSKSVFNMDGGVIENCSRAVTAGSKATFNMSGGEIRNCGGGRGSGNGGGVRVYEATFVMSDGTISGCSADNGGGLCAENSSTVTITGGTISKCTAEVGGGLYADNSTITIKGGTISGCTARNNGGGLYATNSSTNSSIVNISGGMISGCTARNNGGGLYATNSSTNSSIVNISGGTISGCTGVAGGGLYADNSIVTINNGTISGCKAGMGAGGGLYATNQSTITIKGGTISGCEAGAGGGLYVDGSTVTIAISGGTISECSATINNGGGLYATNSSEITIKGGTISRCKGELGCGLYATDSSKITISGGTISGCEGGRGGGLYVEKNSTITITGGTISRCEVGAGGGLFVTGSTLNIEGGTISECSTTLDTGKGGGLYAENSTLTISGGTIKGNKAARGGGVALTNSTVTDEKPIRNWTVVDNEAYKTGGGIWLGENVKWDISDRTKQIYNNQAIEHGADICLEGGTSAIKLPNAANMGATFGDSGIKIDNWYNDNPRYTPPESGQVVKANKWLNGGLSLVASYKADPVRIEIDANGGKGGSGSQTVQKGTTVTLEAPTKKGHLFKGWKDEKGKSYPAGEDGKVHITVNENMKLTAVWDARSFTVTYVLLNGETRTETAAYGKTVTLGEEPRTGYTFVGWNDGEKVYHAGKTITVTGDMTLTAEWKKLPSAENLPKTGDESPVLLWGAALAVSAAACFMLRRRK